MSELDELRPPHAKPAIDRRAFIKRSLTENQTAFKIPKTIPPRLERSTAPLSYAQQRLWFLDQLEPGNSNYNITTVLRLKGELNIPSLEASLNEIVRRHEVLRTTFLSVDGKPLQQVNPHQHLALIVEDLSAQLPDEGLRIAEQIIKRRLISLLILRVTSSCGWVSAGLASMTISFT